MFDITQVKTLTGLDYSGVLVKLDEELPPDAYAATPGAANLTDIDPNYMRVVLTEIFGMSGFGWGYRYSPDMVETRQESRARNAGGSREVVVAVVKHLTFWYKLVTPDGEVVVCEVPSTGASENSNDGYALSGAVTNAIGKAVSNLLFQVSVYLGKRSHQTVRKPKPATSKVAGNGSAKAAAATPKTPARARAAAPAKPASKDQARTAPAAAEDDIEDLAAAPAVPAGADNPAEFVIPLGKRAGQKLGEQEPSVIEWYAASLVADNPEKQALQSAAKALLASLQPA